MYTGRQISSAGLFFIWLLDTLYAEALAKVYWLLAAGCWLLVAQPFSSTAPKSQFHTQQPVLSLSKDSTPNTHG